jgi:hypothetical protein
MSALGEAVETSPLIGLQSGNDADLRFVISIDYGTTFTGMRSLSYSSLLLVLVLTVMQELLGF